MKTIANCRVIRTGKWLGAGIPKNDGVDKCEGYCTETSDEPCEKCKRCKYLKNWEEAQRMAEKRDYYQVFWDGCPGIVHETLNGAIEDISESLKDEVNREEETGDYKIKTIQMTPEEFAALPEFDGY